MIWSYSKCFFASILCLAFSGVSFAQSAPATAPQPAAVANSEVVAPRGATTTLDEMIQAKLDSMDRKKAPTVKVNSDSLAKAKADSIRRMIQEGKYV